MVDYGHDACDNSFAGDCSGGTTHMGSVSDDRSHDHVPGGFRFPSEAMVSFPEPESHEAPEEVREVVGLDEGRGISEMDERQLFLGRVRTFGY